MLNDYKKKTEILTVISLTRRAKDWLETSRYPKILHVFDCACNLVNERAEVLSIVSPDIGSGPFNLVVEDQISFLESFDVDTQVFVLRDRLKIGDLTVVTTGAEYWSPRPAWETLYDMREEITDQLTALPIPPLQSPQRLIYNFSRALAKGDGSSSKVFASQLVGLGVGLTPAGDDFIMGALYAAHIIHPRNRAEFLVREVTDTAVPLTTSLSAAWLSSAGKGEAGAIWHELFDALILYDIVQIHFAMEKIKLIGATSGIEALAGFIATFQSYAEIK